MKKINMKTSINPLNAISGVCNGAGAVEINF